ncbi:MAG TPA: hypothetical protein VEJ45_08515 [Candidatus Acidoferrales bacterium]|nr:hypothetical protein [Candidatus Acidoferrales bacterium]
MLVLRVEGAERGITVTFKGGLGLKQWLRPKPRSSRRLVVSCFDDDQERLLLLVDSWSPNFLPGVAANSLLRCASTPERLFAPNSRRIAHSDRICLTVRSATADIDHNFFIGQVFYLRQSKWVFEP